MTQSIDTPLTTNTYTDTVRAAVVTEFGAPLQISELELPTPGDGEALVKLETSGVCHTDLHAAHGDFPSNRNRRPFPATRATAPSSDSVKGLTTCKSATRSETPGSGRLAAVANTAAPAGKRCVRTSATVTDTRPGQWVAIPGIGGLGHVAVQYACEMGLRVVAIDVDDSKLALALGWAPRSS